MTSPLRITIAPAALTAALFASTLLSPAPAVAGPTEQAVAQCRIEMLSQFPEGSVRHHRVAEISANARRTRVSFIVNADRRYTFECTAGANGGAGTPYPDAPPDPLAAGRRRRQLQL
ncbi:MAG: hypothetical protein ACXWUN_00345 [Allosphingosinicella sp.]